MHNLALNTLYMLLFQPVCNDRLFAEMLDPEPFSYLDDESKEFQQEHLKTRPERTEDDYPPHLDIVNE